MPVETSERPGSTTWIVTLKDGAPVEETRRAIASTGFTIEQFLLPASMFIVSGTEDQAEKARRIHGVMAVEADLKFDIGPPDAAIS